MVLNNELFFISRIGSQFRSKMVDILFTYLQVTKLAIANWSLCSLAKRNFGSG